MEKALKVGPAVAALMWLLLAGGSAALPGRAAAQEDRVTFVENVRCDALGQCEAVRRTIPVFETVREMDRDDFCVEYTKRFTGFRTYPSIDPEQPIQVPQFEQSTKRYFRCVQRETVARAR